MCCDLKNCWLSFWNIERLKRCADKWLKTKTCREPFQKKKKIPFKAKWKSNRCSTIKFLFVESYRVRTLSKQNLKFLSKFIVILNYLSYCNVVVFDLNARPEGLQLVRLIVNCCVCESFGTFACRSEKGWTGKIALHSSMSAWVKHKYRLCVIIRTTYGLMAKSYHWAVFLFL